MGVAHLYCGDCEKILDGLEIENAIIVTDPPFNIGYHYSTYKDKRPKGDYFRWLARILGRCPFVCVHYPESLYGLCQELQTIPERVVSWVYPSNTPRQHRDIAFVGVAPDFRKVTQPYKNQNDKRIKALIAKGRTGARVYDWWEINQVKNTSAEKTEHPCQMPLEIVQRIVDVLPADATIIDPFMGSGTTGVAALRGGRNFVGIELDERYFSIATDRISAESDITIDNRKKVANE